MDRGVQEETREAFYDLIGKLLVNPYPDGTLSGPTRAHVLATHRDDYTVPFDAGRGLLFYFLDPPTIVLVDVILLEARPPA
ncbi:MAG TPA: hypothetical protein VHJ34_15330 [Actinomycetota bacterium]|nr:hypothetical protein [Actinomycetota bacterium]